MNKLETNSYLCYFWSYMGLFLLFGTLTTLEYTCVVTPTYGPFLVIDGVITGIMIVMASIYLLLFKRG